MKKIFIYAVAAITTMSLSLTSCKKGEGDPFISLKSRKSRLAGEWTVSAGNGTDMNSGVNTTWTYDGTQEVTTYPSPFPQTTDKWTLTHTIEKDGTFTSVYVDNDASPAETTTTTGTWNFTGGVGEYKNKSQVVFTTLSMTSSAGGSVTYTGSDAPTIMYDIYQLKNKEVIVKYDGTTSSPSSSSSGEYTWTAK
ncbi:MAG: hypothetical protein ACOZCO_12670 [Bacteroidota bacterium]